MTAADVLAMPDGPERRRAAIEVFNHLPNDEKEAFLISFFGLSR